MKELYQELLERLKYLEEHFEENKQTKKADEINGRILEMQLVILRVQQILLADIKPIS